MNLLLPVALTLLLTGMIAVPSPDEVGPPELQESFRFTSVMPDGSRVSIVLDSNLTFLTDAVDTEDVALLLAPRDLYIQTCWPCNGNTLPAYAPLGYQECVIGPGERDELRVCFQPREVGGTVTLRTVMTDDRGDALFVWGDGCIVHERDGLPPQRFSAEGIVLPAATLTLGGSC